MKTIEEATEEYIDNCQEVENCECAWQTIDAAFKAGCEFAQRWISFEEKIPRLVKCCFHAFPSPV